jgi:predicted enzyme related to lactoylglutathione lyase
VRLWIHARDPRRAAAFYTAVFGWFLPTDAGRCCWVVTSSDDQRLGLDNTDANGPGIPTVHVADLEATSRLAVAAGGEILVSRIPQAGAGWLVYLADTEGNLIGIMQDDPDARWPAPDNTPDQQTGYRINNQGPAG